MHPDSIMTWLEQYPAFYYALAFLAGLIDDLFSFKAAREAARKAGKDAPDWEAKHAFRRVIRALLVAGAVDGGMS